MTLGEIFPSPASSAKCIGQKHQSVILGELLPSFPINVNFIAFKFTVSICQIFPDLGEISPTPPRIAKKVYIF